MRAGGTPEPCNCKPRLMSGQKITGPNMPTFHIPSTMFFALTCVLGACIELRSYLARDEVYANYKILNTSIALR